MALVTLQRSPSPSNDPDEESAEGGDEVDGKSALRHKSLSESYFTVKGAALILPHSDLNRKTSRKNHGGEIQRHLQSMLYLLRPEDKIKVAIRLENPRDPRDLPAANTQSYMALVSTMGRQDTEEFVILGLDCTTSISSPAPTRASGLAPPSTPPTSPTSHAGPDGAEAAAPLEARGIASANIGLVLPIWMGMKVRLSGDGGFSIITDDKSYLFKPVSVQAMWSAIQSVDRAVHQAEHMKYLAEGLTHTWVHYYRGKADSANKSCLAKWNLMEDVEIFAPASLSLTSRNESEKLKLVISGKLKEVMMSVDLDEATSRSLRQKVEAALNMKLDEYRAYFDEELIRILGQMDAPSQILDFLYLGSEWNASNLEELQKLGIKYILNVTREIDNFFTGMLHYYNVRLYDVESSDLLKFWPKTHKFIHKAKKHGSKVLVHCKMGVSRSASTVMAYLMKENRWSLTEAFDFVKARRSCVRPNKGFMEQLHTYEGILNASNKREVFRSRSEQDEGGVEGEEVVEGPQQGFVLGDSLFRVMQGTEGLIPDEELILRKGSDYTGMEQDFETDSRSADSMEEYLPDLPSPNSEQSPSFSTQPQEGEAENGSGSKAGQALTVGEGPSRIKPDSSWIKLESIGESSTDQVPPESMEVEEAEVQVGEVARKENGGSKAEPVIFQLGSEGEGETSTPVPKIVIGGTSGESSDDTCPMTAEEKTEFDMGVHQYYSREQIPWNHGKVRDLREEFCGPAQSATPASGSGKSKAAEEESVLESERTLLEAVSHVKEAPATMPQCESCVELSALDTQDMEIDGRPRSVYEREEIPLIPGTVQRTRQEIEQRQKLFGEDCDQAIFGMKAIRRTSSLREERDSSRNRNSERRKTCTPIVSPPPEPATEMEGAGEEGAGVGLPTLRLECEGEAGVPEDVEMVEVVEGEREGEGRKEVTVYTFGEECVPVKVGKVLRHKQEIENKGTKARQRSMSSESAGSASLDDVAETAGLAQQFTSTHTQFSEIPTVTDSSHNGLKNTHSIPTAKQQWPYLVQPSLTVASPLLEGAVSKQSEFKLDGKGETEGPFSASLFGAGKGQGDGSKFTAQQHPKNTMERGLAAVDPLHTPRSRFSSEGSEDDGVAEPSQAKTERGSFSFRPYSHSFPSTKKPVAKSNFDPETLAMIREIGSAFITSPTRTEEESSGERTSLVKHLVKNIEKETKHPKHERKIIILDSSGRQEKQHTRSKSGPSLYKPSPEFASSMARHLSESSEQSCASQSQPGQSFGELSSEAGSPAQACGGEEVPSLATSSKSSLALSERSKSDHAPSVVRHLCGKFESHSPYGDSSEGEQSVSGTSDSSANAAASVVPPASHHHGDSRGCRQEWEHSAVLRSHPRDSVTKSKSLEEQSVPESRSPSSHVTKVSSDSVGSQSASRRPRSAEDVPSHYTPGLRHGVHMSPRLQSPWNREAGAGGVLEEEEASEGVKIRKLHGKSHPLSRLQQQGDVPYPPTIQRYSPSHSSM
ncbi:uncharacterized protein [Littorina saxatilis]|uniref:uncharacterized protein isoform X2 n=1 Tax=Littorina saxatilis TaxID=31220 RepID=UPI0038B4F92F